MRGGTGGSICRRGPCFSLVLSGCAGRSLAAQAQRPQSLCREGGAASGQAHPRDADAKPGHGRAGGCQRSDHAAGSVRQRGLGATGRSANNSPGNLAFSGAGQVSWRADAGSGSSSAGRVTASPIVFANHVFALDAEGNVSAFQPPAVGRLAHVPEAEREAAAAGSLSAAAAARVATAAVSPSTAAAFMRRAVSAMSSRSTRDGQRSGRSSSMLPCAPRRLRLATRCSW